jgi:hypothetical protein
MADSASLWRLLTQAAGEVETGAFGGFFELKRLLDRTDPKSRRAFQKLFTNYYGLGGAGLTEAFKVRYFKLLFACTPIGQEDPYTSLLLKLYRLPNRQGYHTIQASFVSKLVSIRDESRPIYDRYVSHFFGLRVPSVAHPPEARIAGFISILERIQNHYEKWAADRRFRDLKTTLLGKQPKLKDCHPSRLCDLLVWTVGKKKLT